MKTLAFALIAAAAALGAGCGDDSESDGGDADVTPDAPTPDGAPAQSSIVATAQATPSLSTLVAAVTFASNNNDLVDLLANPGTLTVFAPTNAAFDALAVELTGSATATGADLLTAANKPLLRTVLQYHVLTAEVKAAMIPFGKPIASAEGFIFKIDSGTPPKITDGRNRISNITATDIDATNGVVHLVDKVILPADKNVVQTAIASAPEFSILVEAVTAAGLGTALSAPGPLTVFAPTNAAFGLLLTELGLTKQQLLANVPLLTTVLTYHVVNSRVFKVVVPIGAPIATLETGTFTVSSALVITDERARTSNLAATDILTSNGVIHVVDKVLLPAP